MIEYINSLKWPAGDFSHTDLAKLNGKTNQQVWTRYEQARKDGYILTAGEKKLAGKGKPTKMWKLNPNFVAPVVPATPATPAAAPSAPAASAPAATPSEPVVEAAGDNIVLPSDAEMEAAADAAASAAPAVTAPAVAPATVTPAATPSVATVIETAVEAAQTNGTLPAAEPAVAPAVSETVVVAEVQNQNVLPNGTTQLTEKCPVCNEQLYAVPDATGVMVWCAQPADKCKSTENPFGHGSTAKEGYKALMDKWTRAMSGAAVAA